MRSPACCRNPAIVTRALNIARSRIAGFTWGNSALLKLATALGIERVYLGGHRPRPERQDDILMHADVNPNDRRATDTLELLLSRGRRVEVVQAVPPEDVLSINTPEDLATVDRIFRSRDTHSVGAAR